MYIWKQCCEKSLTLHWCRLARKCNRLAPHVIIYFFLSFFLQCRPLFKNSRADILHSASTTEFGVSCLVQFVNCPTVLELHYRLQTAKCHSGIYSLSSCLCLSLGSRRASSSFRVNIPYPLSIQMHCSLYR